MVPATSTAAGARLAEIMADLRVPGVVTPLLGAGLVHHRAYKPALGIRLSRVAALTPYIAHELGAEDLRVEPAPEGDMLEFCFSTPDTRTL